MTRHLLAARPGMAVVEFAVGLSVLILLTLGVLDFGRAIWMANTLAHVAREGARFGAAPGRTTAEIQDYVEARAIVPSFSQLNVAVPQRGTCGDPNAPLVVTVTAQFEAATPMISSLWGGGPLPLQASSRMYVERGLPGVGACP